MSCLPDLPHLDASTRDTRHLTVPPCHIDITQPKLDTISPCPLSHLSRKHSTAERRHEARTPISLFIAIDEWTCTRRHTMTVARRARTVIIPHSRAFVPAALCQRQSRQAACFPCLQLHCRTSPYAQVQMSG